MRTISIEISYGPHKFIKIVNHHWPLMRLAFIGIYFRFFTIIVAHSTRVTRLTRILGRPLSSEVIKGITT